jgi:hypothetical protein
MQQCQQQNMDAVATADIAHAMKLTPDDRVSVLSCQMHDLLHGDRETVLVTAIDSSAAQNQFPKFGFFTRDATGLHPANIIARSLIPEIIVWILIPVAFAVLSVNGRRTLGKKAVGLIVRRLDDRFQAFPQALGRECLKLLPATALNAVTVVLMIEADFPFGFLRSLLAGDYQPLITMLEWALGLEVPLLIWWLGPFVVWRGQTWYDRLAGTKVDRT